MSNSGDIDPVATEVERRLMAHERVLKSLIAFMSRSDPQFRDHLAESFLDPSGREGRAQAFPDATPPAAAARPSAAGLAEGGAESLSRVGDGGCRDVHPARLAADLVWRVPP